MILILLSVIYSNVVYGYKNAKNINGNILILKKTKFVFFRYNSDRMKKKSCLK